MKQVLPFGLGALLPTGTEHHIQVTAGDHLVYRRNFHMVRIHTIDDEELSCTSHGLMAVHQNFLAEVIRPIMDDAFQEICVAARRDRLEKITGDDFAPVG